MRRKILLLILVACLMLPLLAACGRTADAIVVGSTVFNGIFSPVFYNSAYDGEIAGLVHTGVYKVDREANLVSLACKYQPPVEYQENGKTFVRYTYELIDGIKFSDGTPVTADDIIFTYKLYLDPTYDGLATLFTLNIPGLKEYRFDDPNYQATEERLKKQAEAELTDEYVVKWLVATYAAYGITEEDCWEEKYYEDPDDRGDALASYANELIANYVTEKLSSGTAEVPDIAGIKKIDEKTVEVIIEGIDPTAELNLAISILPQHYYGKDFKKGDLAKVKELNGSPMGAGPFKFVSYKNNVVTLEANPDYFEGAPELAKLKYQVIKDEELKLEEVKKKRVDISDPPANIPMVEDIEKAGLHYELLLNNGYGYVGINADRVPDKNVRKALMHLMNRAPAVDAYYGDLAEIIERPISKVSWAYPKDAKEYYGYNKDKALEYFKAAGYAQEGGKLVKGGKQFSIELWISSDTHPVVPMFTQMKLDLEGLGAICEVMSVDWNVYNENYNQGLIDVWAAAWGGSADPDMYQIYHSAQIESGNNPYHIRNAELDQLIADGVSTTDKAKRAAIYAKAYDIVMDEAVEMPFYQRCNLYVINQEFVDISSLPANMTPYYEWGAEIHKLRMAQ